MTLSGHFALKCLGIGNSACHGFCVSRISDTTFVACRFWRYNIFNAVIHWSSLKRKRQIGEPYSQLLHLLFTDVDNTERISKSLLRFKVNHMFDVGSRQNMTDMDTSKRAKSKCIATALVCQPCWASCSPVAAGTYNVTSLLLKTTPRDCAQLSSGPPTKS